MTVTPELTLFLLGMAVKYSRYKFVTVSFLKRLRNGRFTSESKRPPGSRIGMKKFKNPLGLLWLGWTGMRFFMQSPKPSPS
jgi:hypothetical protein